MVRAFGAEAAVAADAVTYLRVSMLGLPAMLVVLAATGVLRGLQDTRTPLVVAAAGAVVNAALNLLFVHGLHLGDRRLRAGHVAHPARDGGRHGGASSSRAPAATGAPLRRTAPAS